MRIDPGVTDARRLGESLWLVTLHGEHDLSTAPALEAAFARVESTGATVIVDLTEATFIDSTVLGLLVREHRRGENLQLVAPAGGPARKLLDFVGISGLLSILETRDEALGACPPMIERRGTSGGGQTPQRGRVE